MVHLHHLQQGGDCEQSDRGHGEQSDLRLLVSVCDEAGECRLSTAQPWEESVLVSGLSPFTSYTSTVSVLEADSDQPGQASPPTPR